MMNKMISLIKVDLNNTFGISSLVYNFKNKKNRWQLILFTIAMLSLIPTYIIMINGLRKIYEAYVQIGQQSYFFANRYICYSNVCLVIWNIICIK